MTTPAQAPYDAAPEPDGVEIFCLLREQLNFIYRLPCLMAAAGMNDDDPIVLALVNMLQASIRRYVTARKEA